MNARQAAKKAAAWIEELEDFNQRASAEIKALNACIDSVIAGEKNYCDWCEEYNECQRNCKGQGCSEWWMRMDLQPVQTEPEEGSTDEPDSESILSAGPAGGE